jgi:hypothetical protein
MLAIPFFPRTSRLALGSGLAVLVLLIGLTPRPIPEAAAQAPARKEEPLAIQVRKAIDLGVQFLRNEAKGRGNWEAAQSISVPGGWSALAMLALLQSGVSPEDPLIQRGLEYLRSIAPAQTYVVGLQTMVYCLAGQEQDKGRIQKNVDWLIKARFMDGKKLLGWGYKGDHQADRPDHSCTQYALLGLHEAHLAGAAIPDEVWQSIRDFYINTQGRTGGWGYIPSDKGAPTLTMTTAGLCGLLIAGMDVNKGREKPLGNGKWGNCGVYDNEDNRPVQRALELISTSFPAGRLREVPNLFYYLYGVERAGRLSGQRFFGRHDWYRVGCEYLVKEQDSDGSWRGRSIDGLPVLATSFSLLFLSKGRTPVLISKLAHGPTDDDDWNNDRNDARNLVEFASRELFKRQPLAWQVFDPRGLRAEDAAAVRELAGELLPSPIVYFNGHRSPAPRFTGLHKKLLRQYLENGGFVFAEACCGDKRFDGGFRDLIKEIINDPNVKLEPLSPDHPLWSAAGKKFQVLPNQFKPELTLYGIHMGCKTVVVYSPQDLSCYWESNEFDKGQGRLAFNLGANLIAYATGMELPKDRGTRIELPREDDGQKMPRGALKVAQIRHGSTEGDWKPAPQAMRNLMIEMRDLGLKAELRPKEIDVTSPDIVHYKLLYMHGRNAFSFRKEDLEKLRFNLKHGGLLFADACCGAKDFDQAFRKLVQEQLFPGDKLEPIPLSHELFSKELNGTAITKVQCRREGTDGRPEPEYRTVDPLLEGIKVNGRWAVIYSKYDLGCALEKHQATNCLGHDHTSAVLLGKAVVLYALKR